jgi:hypothetical protein
MIVYTVNPTISTGAYGTGDVIGGKLTISKALSQSGMLNHISVYDDDGEGVQLDFFFFAEDLTGTYTDNAAFTIAAADIPKWIGVASVATGDYFAANADKVATKTPIDIVLNSGIEGNEDLFCVCVIRSTTTFTATTDLRFDFGIL